MPIETRDMPMLNTRADFIPASYNSEARTIDIVWTAGAKGLRSTWDGDYYEELEVSDTAVRLDRLNNGAPFLASHNQYSLEGVIGVVERAWIDKGLGMATIRFSEREDVAPIVADVASGILRNISAGYRVHRYEITEDVDQKIPTYRATDWEPMELSLVPIGFDDQAKVRSEDKTKHQVEIIRQSEPAETIETAAPATANPENTDMPVEDKEPVVVDTAAIDSARAEAVVAERARVTEIRSAAVKASVPADVADKMVADGITIDAARAMIIDHLAANQPKTDSHVRATVTHDQRDTVRDAAENALLHRFDPRANVLTEAGRQFRGLSLLEMGRQVTEQSGVDTRGMAPMELAGAVLGLSQRSAGMHSTSDFPLILANVTNKTLREGYAMMPRTFADFTRQSSASNFKDISRTQIGEFPGLELVAEHGEFKYGTVPEGRETYSLKTYGKIIGITRQTLINDDLDAFTRVGQSIGVAAANLESDLVWAILTANANLADGGALFNSTAVTTAGGHANLAGIGAVISEASLTAARAAFRKQKSLSGYFLNVTPSYLIVPPELEGVANQFTSSQYVAAKSGDINPNYNTQLQVIVEPRLSASSATAWYLAAAPQLVDTIEYAYLSGQEGVYTETRMGFEVDGMEIKARHDFAAKALDFRGLYKNAGA